MKIGDLIKEVSDKTNFIRSCDDFFFEKARKLWNEWKSMSITEELLKSILNMDYDEFCNSQDAKISEIRNKIFKLVSYLDEKAKDKNELNEYTDKRTISRAGIWQNSWVSFLLKYKNGETKFSEGFENIINYLENPEKYFPIISERHKDLIFNSFIGKPYDASIFTQELKECFKSYSNCKNKLNETVCIANMIYEIEKDWNSEEILGLFTHDNTGWQENAIRDSNGVNICLWWHRLPNRKEIKDFLRERLDREETFELYYIQNNRATYKATIVDFSLKDEYETKSKEWKKITPSWFCDNFEDYEDGKRSAAIVFLASKFERLSYRIPIENFKLYKNMTYAVRGGIAAFTKIYTKTELRQKDMINKYIELLEANKNLIFTGAPGTGKTYLARQIAKQMIGANTDEDLERSEQFAFVQFHPSYDYTDFVEGLRPTKPDEHGNIGFELKDGIFKSFCNKALKNLTDSKKSSKELSFENELEKKYQKLIERINDEEIDKIPLKTQDKYAEISKVTDNNNILFKRKDGTASVNCISLERLKRLAKVYTTKEDLEKINNITQSINDVIGGCNSTWYWAVLHYLYKEYGDFTEENNPVENIKEKKYVFVIDEINRGEISKIFGELFFSIDPGYRGEKGAVFTQYSNMYETEKKFFIPENVYIIGTMNDIDRSVESFDFAMRRRFTWQEITAKESAYNMNLSEEARTRMSGLNEKISEIQGLNSSYHIGGAYFLNSEGVSCNDFNKIWEMRLKPLLKEYLRGIPDAEDKLSELKDAYESKSNN